MHHNWDLYFDTSSEYWKRLQQLYKDNENYPKAVAKDRNLHHKFMRSFSRLEGTPIDNDKDNLVSLSLGDHFLAHWLLWKCTKKGYKKYTSLAVVLMYKKALSFLTLESAEQIAKDWVVIKKEKRGPRSEETKRKVSEHNGMKRPEVAQAHAEYMKGNQFHNKKVQCIETGIVYKSAKEAATKNNCNRSSICLACKGVYKTAKSYHWRYV